MSRPIFSENFQERITDIKAIAVDNLQDLDLEVPLSDKEKDEEIKDILYEHLRFTPIRIFEERITAVLEYLTIPMYEGDEALSDDEAIFQPGEHVSKITYTIPYTGRLADFDMGTTLQKEEFKGRIYEEDILLEFYFQGDVDTHAPLIKQKKDSFTRLIRDNQHQLVSQLADIRNELYIFLTNELTKLIDAKRKNIADAKKFL